MTILEDFLSEAEVLNMPFETLEAFVRIFGQEMYKPLIAYMQNPEADPDVVERLEACVGDVVLRNTFHYQVNDRGLKSTIYNCRMKVLPELIYSNSVDVTSVIEDLSWLEENTDNLAATLPIRTNAMYSRALELIQQYERDPWCPHDNEISKNMKRWKEILFLPKRKVAQQTGMRSLSLSKSRWRMQLQAAKYLQYCVNNGIALEIAREV